MAHRLPSDPCTQYPDCRFGKRLIDVDHEVRHKELRRQACFLLDEKGVATLPPSLRGPVAEHDKTCLKHTHAGACPSKVLGSMSSSPLLRGSEAELEAE